jgi:hypothetical protein
MRKVIKKADKSKKKYKKPVDTYLEKYEMGGNFMQSGTAQDLFGVASNALMDLSTGAVAQLIGTLSGGSNQPKVFDYTQNINPVMAYGGMMDYMALGGMMGSPGDPEEREVAYIIPTSEKKTKELQNYMSSRYRNDKMFAEFLDEQYPRKMKVTRGVLDPEVEGRTEIEKDDPANIYDYDLRTKRGTALLDERGVAIPNEYIQDNTIFKPVTSKKQLNQDFRKFKKDYKKRTFATGGITEGDPTKPFPVKKRYLDATSTKKDKNLQRYINMQYLNNPLFKQFADQNLPKEGIISEGRMNPIVEGEEYIQKYISPTGTQQVTKEGFVGNIDDVKQAPDGSRTNISSDFQGNVQFDESLAREKINTANLFDKALFDETGTRVKPEFLEGDVQFVPTSKKEIRKDFRQFKKANRNKKFEHGGTVEPPVKGFASMTPGMDGGLQGRAGLNFNAFKNRLSGNTSFANPILMQTVDNQGRPVYQPAFNPMFSAGLNYMPTEDISLGGNINKSMMGTRGNFSANYSPINNLEIGSNINTDFKNENLGEFSTRYTNPKFEVGSRVNTNFKDKGTAGSFDTRISPTKGLNVTGNVDTNFTKEGTRGNVGVDYRNKLFNANYNLGINPTDINDKYHLMNTFNVGFTPKQGTNIFAEGSFENDFQNPQFKTGLTQNFNATSKDELPVKFAKGGMVEMPNAEVEGGEGFVLPNGEAGEFVGDNHGQDTDGDGQDGVPEKLPAGTEIYSKRIKDKKTGKTMADNAKKRAKELKKIEDAVKERPFDRLLAASLERIKERNNIAAQADMQVQQAVGKQEEAKKAIEGMQQAQQFVAKYGGKIPKYSNGGIMDLLGVVGANVLSGATDALMSGAMSGEFNKKDKSTTEAAKETNVDTGIDKNASLENNPELVKQLLNFNPDLLPQYDNGGIYGDPPPERQTIMPLDSPNDIYVGDVFWQQMNNPGMYDSAVDVILQKQMSTPGNVLFSNNVNNLQSDKSFNSGPLNVPNNLSGLQLSNALNNLTSTAVVSDVPQGMPSTISGINNTKNLDFRETSLDPIELPKAEMLPEEDIPTVEGSDVDTTGYDFTLGDKLGLMGTGIAGKMPLFTTLLNRMGDTPNINPYLNYGKQGLAELEKMKGSLGQLRDENLRDIGLASRTQRKAARGSARSINTLRGLEQLANARELELTSNINAKYADQMSNISKSVASAMDARDRMVMGGEAQRDLADRQDRDNFFTQLNQDFTNMGTAMQKVGRDLNIKQADKDFRNMLPLLNKYGFGVRKNKKGNFELYDTSTGKTANAKDSEKIIANVEKQLEETGKAKVDASAYKENLLGYQSLLLGNQLGNQFGNLSINPTGNETTVNSKKKSKVDDLINNKKAVNPTLETSVGDGNDYIRKRLNFENTRGSFEGEGVDNYGFTGGGGSAKGTAMKAYFDASPGDNKGEKALNAVSNYIIGTDPKASLKGGNTSILTDLNYTREQFDKLPEHIKEELVDWKLNTGRGSTDLLLNALDPKMWSGRDAAEKSSPIWSFVENTFAVGKGDEVKKYEDLTKEDLRKARMRLYKGRIEYLKEKYGAKDKRYLAAKKGFENSQKYR